MLRCPCMRAHRASLRRLQVSWSWAGTGHSTTVSHQAPFQRSQQHNAANRLNRKETENLATTDQDSVTKYRKDATTRKDNSNLTRPGQDSITKYRNDSTIRKGNDVKSSEENTLAEFPRTVTELEKFLKLDRVTVVQCIKDFTGEQTVTKDFVIDKELVKRIIKNYGLEKKLPSDLNLPTQSDLLSKKKVEPIETPVATSPASGYVEPIETPMATNPASGYVEPIETPVATSHASGDAMTDYLMRLKNIVKEMNLLRFPIANKLSVTMPSAESNGNTGALNKNIIEDMKAKAKEMKEKTLSMKQNFIASQTMKEDLIARRTMNGDFIARQTIKDDLRASQTMKDDLRARQTMNEDFIARQTIKDDLIPKKTMKEDLIERQTMKKDLIATHAKFPQGTVSVYSSQALGTMPQSISELCERLGAGKAEVLRQVQEITGETFKEDEIMADKVLLSRLLCRTANETGVNMDSRFKPYTPKTTGKDEVEQMSSNKNESHQTIMLKEQLILENKPEAVSEVASKTADQSEKFAVHEKTELNNKFKTELPKTGKMAADISSDNKFTQGSGSSTRSDHTASVGNVKSREFRDSKADNRAKVDHIKGIFEVTDTDHDKTKKVYDMKNKPESLHIEKVFKIQNEKDVKSSVKETSKQADNLINASLAVTAEPVKLKEETQSERENWKQGKNYTQPKRKNQESYLIQQKTTTLHREADKISLVTGNKKGKETESLKSLLKSFPKSVLEKSLETGNEKVKETESLKSFFKTFPKSVSTNAFPKSVSTNVSEIIAQLFSDDSQSLNDKSKVQSHKLELKNILNKTKDNKKKPIRDIVMPHSNEKAETLDTKPKSLIKKPTITSNFVSESTDFNIDLSIFKTVDSEQNVPEFKIDSIFKTDGSEQNVHGFKIDPIFKTDDSDQNVLAKSVHVEEKPSFEVKENPAFELDELKDTFSKLKVLKSMMAPTPQTTMIKGTITLKDMLYDPQSYKKALEQDYDKEVTQSSKIASRVISSSKKSKEKKSELATGPVFIPRPPVVTIMGHVDHGKTTLLDALRNSRVVDTEFGGITQHIGAFNVPLTSGQSITFLDTPGHAAFSAMRSRGASVTDIIVLVIAAEDGVMPQTIESIKLAQASYVPMIVAINKIDRPNTNVEAVKNLLSQYGVVCEEYGGDVQVVPISALKGINLDKLQECIVSLAEYLQLKGNVSSLVEARIIETRTDVGRGKMATMVINKGVLRKGDYLLSGTTYTKVRSLFDCNGAQMQEAGPGIPVEIGGWTELPQTGDLVQQFATEKQLKQALLENDEIEKEQFEAKAMESASERRAADRETYVQIRDRRRAEYLRWWNHAKKKKVETEILEQKQMAMAVDSRPVIRIIIKGDVSGSVEAIVDTLATFTSDICDIDIVHHGVGNVTEMDLQMASAFNADIYAFQLDPVACKSNSKVTIHHYNIIYHLFAQLVEHINAQLPPTEKEEIIGEAVVQQSFEITVKKDKVQIAGCRCQTGSLIRSKRFRLIRGEEVLYDGTLSSMKHHKVEVNVIKTDQDCGLCLDPGLVCEPGDTIVCYDMVKVKQTLDWKPPFDLKTDDIPT
ncbi:translation initiation factor IF-2-like isoform X2 [Dreissena polymorpha]|uniref:Translation initiation factor IF-2, mitochondrial n=2 Tax=Dreissena polymorpha TaxID=45954 RepID=A0A9D4L076_DREPO|nr:translation initiation factor IF-2-like isoform X2 [Dreissena polymorpha]XP_052273783.1 translation initiation factor IF-2-like isoform X2 [Dreissena polymorpha]KAH3848111.1 hypothetical protein DPMN_090460 [Dreissena polymorpha]